MVKRFQLLGGSETSGHAHSNKQMWGVLIIAIIAVLVGSSLFFFCGRKLSRRWSRKGGLKAEKLRLRRFQLEELEKATRNFSADCLLGSGAFGNVYKGIFEAEGTLAIKRAHAESYQSVEEFRNEVRLLSTVNHPNLIGLVGYCEEPGPKGAKVLVYEYVPHGSLLEYIMGRGGRNLTWRQRVNIAIGAAKGRFSCQIKGTPGYLDPAYCTSFHLSPFSDVYSFGVILLQLVCARPAVDSTRNQPNYHIIDWARPSIERGSIEEILDASLLSEPCNMEMMLKMGELGLRCVVKMPKDRPTMTQVFQELEDTLYSVDNSINKQPWRSSRRTIFGMFSRPTEQGHRRSLDQDYSQSFVSIDGVGFQKFRVEMDSVSLQSTSLRCFEINSVSVDVDKNNLRGISDETGRERDRLDK
ncbi:hypothetical protein POUND7_014419 [Theobroma cacao]